MRLGILCDGSRMAAKQTPNILFFIGQPIKEFLLPLVAVIEENSGGVDYDINVIGLWFYG